ncbi:TPA_asm: hypothetical protein [Capsaspora MELD virus 2]|nr:TPA_asm: hypothetical protein [Capsaspora MELD virus 2]
MSLRSRLENKTRSSQTLAKATQQAIYNDAVAEEDVSKITYLTGKQNRNSIDSVLQGARTGRTLRTAFGGIEGQLKEMNTRVNKDVEKVEQHIEVKPDPPSAGYVTDDYINEYKKSRQEIVDKHQKRIKDLGSRASRKQKDDIIAEMDAELKETEMEYKMALLDVIYSDEEYFKQVDEVMAGYARDMENPKHSNELKQYMQRTLRKLQQKKQERLQKRYQDDILPDIGRLFE